MTSVGHVTYYILSEVPGSVATNLLDNALFHYQSHYYGFGHEKI